MHVKVYHQDLQRLGKKLGFPHQERGICRGFSLMLAQAFLAEDRTTFYERLNLIARYKAADPTFSSLIKDLHQAQEKAKQHKTLTSDEENLMNLLAFFVGVDFYQHPPGYEEVFHRNNIFQKDIA